MPKELPPETAQRVLDYLLAVEESLHPSQSITIFRRITVADFEALHACKPDMQVRYRRKRIRSLWGSCGGEEYGMDFGPTCESHNPPPKGSLPGHYALRGTLWTPATAPEVTAAKAGRDPNGVVAWHGGECPEGSGIVHYRDGETRAGLRFSVHLSDWTRDDDPSDIIAYEVTG
jgi:hypothetical protein